MKPSVWRNEEGRIEIDEQELKDHFTELFVDVQSRSEKIVIFNTLRNILTEVYENVSVDASQL